MHFAATFGRPLETIKAVVEQLRPGALLEQAKDGRTPLHVVVATTIGDDPTSVEVVEYLAKSCPQALQVKDENGFTPLHVAASCRTLNAVQLLTTACRRALEEKAADGSTPLHLAAGRPDAPRDVVVYLALKGRRRSARRTRRA